MVDGSIREFSFIMYERYWVTYNYSKCIALNMMKPLGLYTWWLLFQKCVVRKDFDIYIFISPKVNNHVNIQISITSLCSLIFPNIRIDIVELLWEGRMSEI